MPFENISNMVVTNGYRQVELDPISTFESTIALGQVQKLLSSRAIEMGVLGIWTDEKRNDVVSGQAFHDHGNEMSMLALHAQTMMALSGISKDSSLFTAPWQAHGESYPMGVRPYIDTRDEAMPVSVAMLALDAAVEHAVCMGVASQGYTWQEWEERSLDPDDRERDIAFEPYINDLEQSWAALIRTQGDQLVLAEPGQLIENWPVLLDREKIQTDLEAFKKIIQRSGMSAEGAEATEQHSAIKDVLMGLTTPGVAERQLQQMQEAAEQQRLQEAAERKPDTSQEQAAKSGQGMG